MTKLKQPIKWHGGKHYLAAKIVEQMERRRHTRYLEAFAGGLSVLLLKNPEGVSEWANDLNHKLVNFWRVLAYEESFKRFQRMVVNMPLSEDLFKNSQFNGPASHDPVERAVWFFVRMRQSRQGLGKDYCTPVLTRQRRGMNEQVSAWLTAVDGLADVHQRLRRVEVWRRPAVQAIKKLDHEDGKLMVYADPPYLHDTRSSVGEYGEHEMDESAHVYLLETLGSMRGTFVLSGYRSELYDDYAEDFGWDRLDFELPNNASSAKAKQRKIECLWMNF